MLIEVPSPIDFHNRADAEKWVAETVKNRPYRPRFFEEISKEISNHFSTSVSILELGSGPGHLANAILKHCGVDTYIAMDFSNAMHDIAREFLGDNAKKVTFLEGDFKSNDWTKLVSPYCVVTMQAAHEVRHKSRIENLFRQIRSVLKPGGLFIYCDHYITDTPGSKNPDLYLHREEQLAALVAAGFNNSRRVYEFAEIGLYTSTIRSSSS